MVDIFRSNTFLIYRDSEIMYFITETDSIFL